MLIKCDWVFHRGQESKQAELILFCSQAVGEKKDFSLTHTQTHTHTRSGHELSFSVLTESESAFFMCTHNRNQTSWQEQNKDLIISKKFINSIDSIF